MVILSLYKKRIKGHIGLFLIICLTIILIVTLSNILEHLNISNFIDNIEEYLEILIIPFFLLFIYSISAQNELTQKINKENKLIHALKEREILIKEIHHRIKNNLLTIAGLISIQLDSIKKKEVVNYLNATANRVITLGLLHKKLYKTNDYTQIDLNDYFYNIAKQLISFYKSNSMNIKLKIENKKFYTNIDTAIPCGLMVNEIITNSLQYAFPNKSSGRISVLIKNENKNTFRIIINDNGIGLPAHIDIDKNCGLGLKIIAMLVKQLNGNITISRHHGTEYSILVTKVIN